MTEKEDEQRDVSHERDDRNAQPGHRDCLQLAEFRLLRVVYRSERRKLFVVFALFGVKALAERLEIVAKLFDLAFELALYIVYVLAEASSAFFIASSRAARRSVSDFMSDFIRSAAI